MIQFTVKYEQGVDCGGGYVKLFGPDLDPVDMHGDTPYRIMFGESLCFCSSSLVLSGRNSYIRYY